MLPLACPEAESTSPAGQKIRATPQTRRHQQTCKQQQIASVRLDSGLSNIPRRNGKKHPAQFCRCCSVTVMLSEAKHLWMLCRPSRPKKPSEILRSAQNDKRCGVVN